MYYYNDREAYELASFSREVHADEGESCDGEAQVDGPEARRLPALWRWRRRYGRPRRGRAGGGGGTPLLPRVVGGGGAAHGHGV